MIMFYTLLSCCLLFGLPNMLHATNREYNKFYMFLIFSFLFVVLAFKSPFITVDSMNYYNAFHSIVAGAGSYMEFGYLWFNKFLGLFSDNPQIVFVASSFIISFAVVHLIYNHLDKYMWLAIFLYLTIGLFSYSFNMMRQILAVSFCMLSYNFILKRNFWPFILLVLLATSFHSSAICFVIAYWFPKIKIKMKTLVVFLLILAIILLFFHQVSDLIFKIFPQYALYTEREIAGRLQFGGEARPAAIARFLMNVTILVFSLVVWEKDISIKKNSLEPSEIIELRTLIMFAFCSTLIMSYALRAIVIERVMYYFWAFNIILLPKLISHIIKKEVRIMVILVLMFCALAYIITMQFAAPRLLYFYNYAFCWQ